MQHFYMLPQDIDMVIAVLQGWAAVIWFAVAVHISAHYEQKGAQKILPSVHRG